MPPASRVGNIQEFKDVQCQLAMSDTYSRFFVLIQRELCFFAMKRLKHIFRWIRKASCKKCNNRGPDSSHTFEKFFLTPQRENVSKRFNTRMM